MAVDTRRQRLYRLRGVRSAANTGSDLIAVIAPVKNSEGSPSTFVTTYSAEPYLFKTARRPYLSVRPLCGEGYQEEIGSISGLLSTLLFSRRDVTSGCTYVAIPEAQLRPRYNELTEVNRPYSDNDRMQAVNLFEPEVIRQSLRYLAACGLGRGFASNKRGE
jgi:hypothetical protein